MEQIVVEAAPDSEVPVKRLRIGNATARFGGGPEFVSGLLVEAMGSVSTADEAVALLANAGSPYLQVLATLANAAVEESDDLLAYAPPVEGRPGVWLQQRYSGGREPAATLRNVGGQDVHEFLTALDVHPRQDRLHRAMAHFQTALLAIQHANWLRAAESLYLTVENLQHVIYERLLAEAGLPSTGQSKHQLAVSHGFAPPSEKSNKHLSEFDSYLRKHFIFEDEPIYKKLKDASDHFEHGSRDFAVVRRYASEAARPAFPLVRRAILRETGLRPDSPLFSDKYDSPLGLWSPGLEMRGTYTGEVNDENDPDWPMFLGTNMAPFIADIDDSDPKHRQIQMKVTGNGASLLDDQHLEFTESLWIFPGGDEHKLQQQGEATVEVTHQDAPDKTPSLVRVFSRLRSVYGSISSFIHHK